MGKTVIILSGTSFGASPEQENEMTRKAADQLVPILESDDDIVICYGNGPQSGRINRVFELGRQQGKAPAMQIADCTAMTEGYMGFHLEESLDQAMAAAGKVRPVAAMLTQVIVEETDPAFTDPMRPIGATFTKERAEELMRETGDIYREVPTGGWRRVVPAPRPTGIKEMHALKLLLDQGIIVVAGGGGGIPVVIGEDGYESATADVDQAELGALLADQLDADTVLLINPQMALMANQGSEETEKLGRLTPEQAKEKLAAGIFGKGRFARQVEVVTDFAAGVPGRRAIICDLVDAGEAFKENAGTIIAEET